MGNGNGGVLESESTYGVVGCDVLREETTELVGGLAGERFRKLPSLESACRMGVDLLGACEL